MKQYTVYAYLADNGLINTGLTENPESRYNNKEMILTGMEEICRYVFDTKQEMKDFESETQSYLSEYSVTGSEEIFEGITPELVRYIMDTKYGNTPAIVGNNPLVMFILSEYNRACDMHRNDPDFETKHGFVYKSQFCNITPCQTREDNNEYDERHVNSLISSMIRKGWRSGSVVCLYKGSNIGGIHRIKAASQCPNIKSVPFFEITLDMSDKDLYSLGEQLNTHIRIEKGLSKDIWKKKLWDNFMTYLNDDLTIYNVKRALKVYHEDAETLNDQYPIGVSTIRSILTAKANYYIEKEQNIIDGYVPVSKSRMNAVSKEMDTSYDKTITLSYNKGNKGNLYQQLFALSNYETEGKTSMLLIRFPTKQDREGYDKDLVTLSTIRRLKLNTKLLEDK